MTSVTIPKGNLKILQTIYYKNSNFKLDLIFMKIALPLLLKRRLSEGIFYVLYNFMINYCNLVNLLYSCFTLWNTNKT